MPKLKPIYDDGIVVVYHGDAIATLRSLRPRSAQLILTDPPFNISDQTTDVVLPGRVIRRDMGAFDHEQWHPKQMLGAALRVLQPGGSLIAFAADQQIAQYKTVAKTMSRGGDRWSYRGTVVWVKPNPPVNPRLGYSNATEYVVWMATGSNPAWNDGAYVRNVEECGVASGHERVSDGQGPHPNQKPLALVSRLLLRHSNAGDIVIDPYAGTGTTARACKDNGRRCIAIERDERFVAMMVERLKQDVLFAPTAKPFKKEQQPELIADADGRRQ